MCALFDAYKQNKKSILSILEFLIAVIKETKSKERYYFLSNLSTDTTREFKINGQSIDVELQIFQSAVYRETNGTLEFLGKTETC